MSALIRGRGRASVASNEHPAITFGGDLAAELEKAQQALATAKAGGDERSVTYYTGVIDRLGAELRARADFEAGGQPRHPETGQFVSFDAGTRRPLPAPGPTMDDVIRSATGRR